MSEKKIRVLICDDSALVRQILNSVFESDPQIEVVGTASNPLIARQKIKQLNPDVLTLDIEMPEMDGLTFLEKIMTLRPMPVVMISSLTQQGTAQTLRALELGVCDIVGKPTSDLQTNFQTMKHEIITKVKAAATARIRPPMAMRREEKTASKGRSAVELIAFGASTGGVVALKEVLPEFPIDSPPIVIVQHMPEAYTPGFAERLDIAARVNVVESEDGMELKPGCAYLANGGQHMKIVKRGTKMYIEQCDTEAVSGHRPSVDVTFESIAENIKGKVVASILTGMGRDGARGMLALRRAGALTIGQSEDTCVVYGMPRVAFEVGGVEKVLPLSKIGTEVQKACWPGA
ncbi:protein-glutamate methylesterase/protein-glutamine glutaminase [Kordiimonas laminariae]|uniref:protein-glutamate methylesterase/protein-glutamine glutaminase n=1 Tax=Kordiimonas laminariae TaxID=2917717 RepID=UPI001FF61326|nr:chemotaxis response regulator protein-glutamate methylesterase [Kordiimonas laminariae]MCK0069696.1 chemotaxis response regulator protein-glutamate methylesterase [Kordiimonas laminariae]